MQASATTSNSKGKTSHVRVTLRLSPDQSHIRLRVQATPYLVFVLPNLSIFGDHEHTPPPLAPPAQAPGNVLR